MREKGEAGARAYMQEGKKEGAGLGCASLTARDKKQSHPLHVLSSLRGYSHGSTLLSDERKLSPMSLDKQRLRPE